VGRAARQTLIDTCPAEEVRHGLAEFGQEFSAYPSVFAGIPPEDCVGGNGFTHGILNYGRIVIDGFGRYIERISAGLATAAQTGNIGRRAGLAACLQPARARLQVVGSELRLALRPHKIKTVKLYTTPQEENTRG
jgi:hypothetical protein